MVNEPDYLLESALAGEIFSAIADLPIIDYHNHLDPKQLADNQPAANITRLWLGDGCVGDHYKWRLMRANGVPEELITGDGDDREKLIAFAGALEQALGNPVYEWSHLELRRYFGIDLPITTATAPEIWDRANELVETKDFLPQTLLKNRRVEVAVTTDDPTSELAAHQQLAAENLGFQITPSFRPDPVLAITDPDFSSYLAKLSAVGGKPIHSFTELITVLDQRMGFFASVGGRNSDHGLDSFTYVDTSPAEADAILAKRLAGQPISASEADGYRTALLRELLGLNRVHNWVAQIHCGAKRRQNLPMTAALGPDTGFDSVGAQPDLALNIMRLIRSVHAAGQLPRLIVYPLNANDWTPIASYLGNFQGEGKQQLQLGPAWWFNDHYAGIRTQLELFANQSLLGNFTGMLTDSRSLLSFTRHEYFRRILANKLAQWYQLKRVTGPVDSLVTLASNVAYYNAKEYFGF